MLSPILFIIVQPELFSRLFRVAGGLGSEWMH